MIDPLELNGMTAEDFDLVSYLIQFDQDLLECAEGRRILTRYNPLLFAILYLKEHIKNKETGEISFADCHFEWCRVALSWLKKDKRPRQNRTALIAPRNAGKSTWFLGVGILPMWAAAHGHVRFIAAFADSASQSQEHLASFRDELDRNELLQNDFPKFCQRLMKVQKNAEEQNNRTVLRTNSKFIFTAKGASSRVLGTKFGMVRPDLIILDDMEPQEEDYSPAIAAKRLGTVIESIFYLEESAPVVLVGTVTMPGSIMHQLVQSKVSGETPTWVKEQNIKVCYQAPFVIKDDGTERSFWPNGPSKFNIDHMNAVRQTRDFKKNSENNPSGYDGGFWSSDDITYGELPLATRFALFVDPAVTAKDKSDFTGLAVVGYSPTEDRVIVLHAEGVKLKGKPLRDRILQLIRQYPRIKLVRVEVNQGGDLWYDVFNNLPCKLSTDTVSDKKEVRFARALDYYQQRPTRVVHAKRMPLLEDQMTGFPKIANDDILDAVVAGVLYFMQSPPPKVVVSTTTHSYV